MVIIIMIIILIWQGGEFATTQQNYVIKHLNTTSTTCLQCIQHHSSQALCFFTFKHVDTLVNTLCSDVGLSRGHWNLNGGGDAKSSYPLNQNITFVGSDCEMLIRT